MQKEKLLIFPFNGNGLEALDCIDFDKYDFVGFVDDDRSKTSESYMIYSRSVLKEQPTYKVLAVPGSPTSYMHRADVISSLDLDSDRFITAIHPKASLGKNVKIGYNCLIMAGVVLTSNACLQNHVCVLPNTVIHHDVVVNDYTLIGSNVVVAGGVRVGANCYLGSGTNVINGIQIGAFALLGLGSNVVKSVASNIKVAGNPAKAIDTSNKISSQPTIHNYEQ
jgi:sugar O-acyltransferase (sialic acid O-acetyltransferase NeuD family)